MADLYAQILVVFRDQGRRTANPDFCAKFQETKYIAQRHAAVQDVTNDGYFFARHLAESFPNRKCVKQRLGWVFVGAVAGIDDISRDSA